MGYLKNLNHLHLQNYTTHDDIIAFGVCIPASSTYFLPSIMIWGKLVHMSTRQLLSAVEYICLTIRHISRQYASIPIVATTSIKNLEYLFSGCNIISADIILLWAACCNFPQYLQVILSEADNGPDSSVGCIIISKATY